MVWETDEGRKISADACVKNRAKMGDLLLEHSGRAAKTILAGVLLFLLLSVFSSVSSPDTENRTQVEKNCKNDWKKCASKDELLKNWNYELKTKK